MYFTRNFIIVVSILARIISAKSSQEFGAIQTLQQFPEMPEADVSLQLKEYVVPARGNVVKQFESAEGRSFISYS
jgi:hypothetical protein